MSRQEDFNSEITLSGTSKDHPNNELRNQAQVLLSSPIESQNKKPVDTAKQLPKIEIDFGNSTDKDRNSKSDRKEENTDNTRRTDGKFEDDFKARHDFLAKDANAMRSFLKSSGTDEKLEQKDRKLEGATIKVEGPNGEKLTVSTAFGKGISVVSTADKIYLLNNNNPELDTVFQKDGKQAPSKIDWSANPEIKMQMTSQVNGALVSLRQQATDDGNKDVSVKAELLDTSVAILKNAHKEGLFDTKSYAEDMAFTGLLSAHELDDSVKGNRFAAEALNTLENEFGSHDADSLHTREIMIRNSIKTGDKAGAKENLDQAIKNLDSAGIDKKAISIELIKHREFLTGRLESVGRNGEANAMRNKSYDTIIANKNALPENESAFTSHRESLIEHYVKNYPKNGGKALTLLDQSAANLKIDDNNPDSRLSAGNLAEHYLKIGETAKAGKLYEATISSISNAEKLPGADLKELMNERLKLSPQSDKNLGTGEWIGTIAKSNIDALHKFEQSNASKETIEGIKDSFFSKLNGKDYLPEHEATTNHRFQQILNGNSVKKMTEISDVLEALSIKYYKAGDFQNAAQRLEVADRYHSNEQTAISLAHIYEKLGRTADAAVQKEKANKLKQPGLSTWSIFSDINE